MTADKPNTKPALPAPRKLQLRANLRTALDLMAFEGKSQRDAAAAAGMNETALSRALQKPHVRAHLEGLKADDAIDALALKKRATAMAIRRGIMLMHEAKSEAVQARMVELFAGEAKGAPMVQVNVGQARGYEYLPPARADTQVYAPLPNATSGTPAQVIEHDQGDTGEGVA